MEATNLLSYTYPNESVAWSFLIVLYPYITGLVAGAFVVSSLYHVFNRSELRPVARMSLVAAFAFLAFAATPLLLHLGHPERALNIMVTPNLRSAMAGFGFIYLFYLTLLTVELWFVFRADLVRRGASVPGVRGWLYRAAALFSDDLSPEALAIDHRFIKILAAVGIPSACVLHGYVGFIFGAVKANPWWSTALMPIIFLLSAIVSGIALVVIVYLLGCRWRREAADPACLGALLGYLWGFLIVDVTVELLELANHAYESTEDWGILRHMIATRIGYSFIGVQFLIGSLVPFLLLGAAVIGRLRGRLAELVGYLAAVVLLLQVFAMRWNVVIGGQIPSKSLRGLISYTVEWHGREGALVGLAVLVAPLLLLAVLARILPLRHAGSSGRTSVT